jgi:acetylornithine deacetylase
VTSYPGLDTPANSGIVEFVKSLTGGNSTCKVAFGTEGGLFHERLGLPTVVCGTGSMD